MAFPYGEWLIFSAAFVTWVKRSDSRRLFLLLLPAWLLGKGAEFFIPSQLPWHWQFGRLAVMLVFWLWAWRRSERRIFPLCMTSLCLTLQTLYLVNLPGIVPFEDWLFTLGLFLVAYLTARTFWGAAAAFAGGILLNQAVRRFTYEGLVRYADFPDTFVWNAGVGLLVVWVVLRWGWRYCGARGRAREGAS